MWTWALEQRERGLIKRLGFSFHSTPEELERILSAHPEAEFVQLQINYADWDSPDIQSRRCLEVARAHGKPVVVMEPVKGGMLATPPQTVVDILKAAEPDSSPASWALRFAADAEGVEMVLSGMSDVGQVKDNVAVMKEFSGLTGAQRETLEAARQALADHPVIPCTSCNYCAEVCPMEIGISGTFSALNCLTLYNNMKSALGREKWRVTGQGKKRADECIECGACEEVCPQHISIRDELKKAREAFGM